MSNINQYIRTVGAGKTFLSPTEYIIYCNTNDNGVVNVVLPKISELIKQYFFTGNTIFQGIRIQDIGNNASNNKIIVECMDGDKIGFGTKVEFDTNGIGLIFNFTSPNNWFYTSSSSFNKIDIPTPFIKIGEYDFINKHPKLYAYYLPTGFNDEFLKYNPKYFLFMAHTNRWHYKKVNGVNTKIRRHSGFYHPTHQNGINFPNSNYYSGQTQIPLDTEYPLIAGAYKKTLIPFNPYQFTRFKPIAPTMPSPLNLPSNINLWKFQGRKGFLTLTRGNLFSIAIGIENPDPTASNPILFGELSEPFRVQFIYSNGNVIGFSYVVQLSSVKRNMP
jgi:hypothetical protein